MIDPDLMGRALTPDDIEAAPVGTDWKRALAWLLAEANDERDRWKARAVAAETKLAALRLRAKSQRAK